MGSLVQIKSDTHAAWMGGIPNSDWTDLKISTTDPQQSSQIHPMLDNSSFCEQSKGLDVKFSKKKETCLVFNVNYSGTSKILITYLKDLGDPTKMLNLLKDHTQFTQAYTKTAIKEQCNLYNSYDHSSNHGACHTLVDSLDKTFKTFKLLSLTTCVSHSSGCRTPRPCKVTSLNIPKQ